MWSLKKLISAYLFQIARENSCDYVLIIYMKKIRDSLSRLCRSKARIKWKNNLFKPCKWHCAFGQNNGFTIKTIIYSDIFTSLRPKKVQLSPVQGIVQSILLFLCTELTLYCIELPENCIYLKQSELSNFSCICLTLSRSVCTLSILFSMHFLRCWHCQFV